MKNPTKQPDAHDLMPDDVAAAISALRATENEPDPTAHVKWFTPDAGWTWYVLEYDPHEKLCFGLVEGHVQELGYFSLAEVEHVRGPLGLCGTVSREQFTSLLRVKALRATTPRGSSRHAHHAGSATAAQHRKQNAPHRMRSSIERVKKTLHRPLISKVSPCGVQPGGHHDRPRNTIRRYIGRQRGYVVFWLHEGD